MKEILFKHKKSGVIISLESIKESDPSSSFKICNPQNTPFSCEPYINARPSADYDEYMIREIPFSNDFEIIVVDDDFNEKELCMLAEGLMSNPYISESKESLLNKVREKINATRYAESQIRFRR